MRIVDYVEQSFSNLWKKKLRTFLTTFGVIIGIGALVTMISFGKGVQKNLTDKFQELELFNYVTLLPSSSGFALIQNMESAPAGVEGAVLDEATIEELKVLEGVVSVFPEVRFPARIMVGESRKYTLIQVLPAQIAGSELVNLRAGLAYESDNSDSVIVSDSLLSEMGIKDPESAVGQEIQVSTVIFSPGLLNPTNLPALLQGGGLPVQQETYSLTITGIAERMGMIGPIPLRSNIFIPPGTAERMKKISLTSIFDFFQSPSQGLGYSMVNVRLSSPTHIERIKSFARDRGFQTFALIDQLEEIKTGFVFMDMFLAAVGMIAIVVASLGIVNTMVMSIMERYKEIGIMKAVGAGDGDISKIILFESGVIGFLGGLFGLALGWIVSLIINLVLNSFLAKQGVPYINYFSFTWWLCIGAVLFSVLVSLISGAYPMKRAASVDPVVALRHD
ncbi:ABC transporter permease [Acidobacteriota bacterium]